MIVVCGDLAAGGTRPADIARGAVVTGAGVQLVGVVPDDDDGDRSLIELAQSGVGHAAVLREPRRTLEPADLDLALRYLPEVRVVVLVEMPAAVVGVASDHAAWTGAALVVIGGAAVDGPTLDLPTDATVLKAPERDPDGTFAGFVGAFAARLDAGETPADAWAATTSALAVDPV